MSSTNIYYVMQAATEYDTLLEINPMLDCDSELLIVEKLKAGDSSIDKDVLAFMLDLGEGNPAILCELCQSVLEAGLLETIEDEVSGYMWVRMKSGKSMDVDLKLNTKLRHMVLQVSERAEGGGGGGGREEREGGEGSEAT